MLINLEEKIKLMYDVTAMTVTLYRKYRPQTFGEVVGQNHIKITLQNELETGRVSHAYLFSGPRGLGKTTIARLLAKSVNCLNRKDGQSEPCNQCDSCKEIVEGHALDVIEIDAASHTGVDNVRENIINNARFTPSSRKFKVFIIDEVHMLSTSAFNALLKTLEEPPSHAIFILATTEIHKIPQTIISRCQRFDFRKVSRAEMLERLNWIIKQEKKQVDSEILDNISHYAEGCLRDAETILGQVLSLDDKKITKEQAELVIPTSRIEMVLELISHLTKKDSASAIALVNRLIQEGVDLQRFASDLIEVLRKVLLIKIDSSLEEFSHGFGQRLEEQISAVSKEVNLKDLVLIINVFIKAKQDMKSAEISQMPLEIAIVEICNNFDHSKPDDDNQGGGVGLTAAVSSKDLPNPVKNVPPSATKAIKQEIKIAKQEEEIASPKPIGKITLTLQQLHDKWEEVLFSLKDHNQSLASTLRLHKPSAIRTDGVVEICFKYKFHQQRVSESKNRQLLEKSLENIFNMPLRVQTAIVEDLPDSVSEAKTLTQTEAPGNLVDNLLKNFGGQLVE